MRKRDTTKRCFICIQLGHLSNNYMNKGRIEDEKKNKAENIRKKMRQQWVPKSPENANQDHEVNDIQVKELDDSNISS